MKIPSPNTIIQRLQNTPLWHFLVQGGKVSVIRAIGLIAIPLIGIGASVYLVKVNQDIRQQASEGVYSTCANGELHGQTACAGYSPDTCVKCVDGKFVPAPGQCKSGPCAPENQDTERSCADGTVHGQTACAGVSPDSCVTCKDGVFVSTPGACRSGPCESPEPTPTPTPTDKPTPTEKPTPIPTPTGKSDGETCNSNADCQSGNCAAAPGGKYCIPAGAAIGGPQPLGSTCATTAYDRECEAGLVCENNRCVEPKDIVYAPVGTCLSSGESCEGGRGYVDSACPGTKVRCGAKPSPTPNPIPTPVTIADGKADGDWCNSDTSCQSGNCIAAPGGKYCAPAGVSTSSTVAEGGVCGTTVYNRGCAAGLVCSSNRCQKPSDITPINNGFCLENGTNCASGGGYYDITCGGQNIRCGDRPEPTPTIVAEVTSESDSEECPFIPVPNGTCYTNGQACETHNPFGSAEGSLFVCQDNTWQEHGELRVEFADNCSEEEKGIYRQSIANAPTQIHVDEKIKIFCADEGPETIVVGEDGIEYTEIACGQYGWGDQRRLIGKPVRSENITLSCTDPRCHNEDTGYNCDYITTHELAHNYANEEQFFGAAEVESFNRAIGCRSEGKGEFSFNESPVTGYGHTNCAEAYAEAITVYYTNPCHISQNSEFKNHHDWLINSEDSPFQGQELCQEKG